MPVGGAAFALATPAVPWFSRTKLQPPRARGDLLARPRLVAPLIAALSHTRLVLVTAPAGAGKTTLFTALAGVKPAMLHASWVSLDADDNDLSRFLAVLLAALDQLTPGVGACAEAVAQTLGANRSPQGGPGRQDL